MPSKMNRAASNPIAVYLDLLDEGYDRQSWHGPNLRGVTAEQAVRRPASDRHNIWEQAVHAAYWKYATRRRLSGEKRGSFPLAGSNWFERSDGTNAALWKSDLKLLGEMHRALRAAVASLDPRDLDRKPKGSQVTFGKMLRGIACHDVYHAGQIQLLKRLVIE